MRFYAERPGNLTFVKEKLSTIIYAALYYMSLIILISKAWSNAISFFNSLISCSTRKCFISYSVYGVVLWYKLFDIIWNAHYVYEMMLELWNLQSGKHCSLTRSGCLQWPFPALPPAASPTQCCNLRLETNNKIFFSIFAFLNETINKTHLEPNDNSFCI